MAILERVRSPAFSALGAYSSRESSRCAYDLGHHRLQAMRYRPEPRSWSWEQRARAVPHAVRAPRYRAEQNEAHGSALPACADSGEIQLSSAVFGADCSCLARRRWALTRRQASIGSVRISLGRLIGNVVARRDITEGRSEYERVANGRARSLFGRTRQ